MSLNNLLHQHLAERTGQDPNFFPHDRCNGYSTGTALETIGTAMKHQRTKIYIRDHASTSLSSRPDQHTWRLAQDIVGKLQMVGFKFGSDQYGYYVVYNLSMDVKEPK